MTVTFTITDEDLIAQQRNALKHTKFHKKTKIMQMIIYVLSVMFVLMLAGVSTNTIFLGFILTLLLTPLLWKLYEYGLIRRFKKDVLRHNRNKIGDFTLNLFEKELIKESNNLTEKIQWRELSRFKEDDERYFLYFSDLNAITIKKVPDNMNENEITEYQSFIKRKINN
mgnify:CR=1 FL=1